MDGAKEDPPILPPDMAASDGRGAKANAATNAALAAAAFRWLESFKALKRTGVGSVLLRCDSSFGSFELQSGLARWFPVTTPVRAFTEVAREGWGVNA